MDRHGSCNAVGCQHACRLTGRGALEEGDVGQVWSYPLCGAGRSNHRINLIISKVYGNMGMASERVLFWQKKLAENQQILALLDAGQFQTSHGDVLDEQAAAEVREWAARRVAECVRRLAERGRHPIAGP